ncbi:ABC transporter permease subunit [Peribacillus kribbensis]|uniref:ABC transporter permease subunit n=1 Tax=Peribacillus kribbensis TaxID=356658 RepID=UPI000417C648|nr:ABC transporter permease subunit [Peribacillus kribbensis]
MKGLKVFLQYFFTVLVILAVSVIPRVAIEKGPFNITGYVEELLDLIPKFIHPGNWIVTYQRTSFSIMEVMKAPYLISLSVLIGALCTGMLAVLLLRRVTAHLPSAVNKSIQEIYQIFSEAGLSLLIGFGLMYFLSALEIHFSAPVSIIIGILAAAVFPAVYLFGKCLLWDEKEAIKLKSRGFFPIFREFIVQAKVRGESLAGHLRTAASLLIMGLFAVESILQIKGLSIYMAASFKPVIMAAGLLFLYTPFFIITHTASLLGRSQNDSEMYGFTLNWKNRLIHAVKGIGVHFSNPKFTVGFLFLFGLVAFSFFYSEFKEHEIKKVLLLMDSHGKLLSSSPHPPSSQMWFGSDTGGRSIRDQLFVGAKYTISYGLLIALLRVAGGFFFVIYYTFHFKETTRIFIIKVVDSIHFLPLSLIAIILLNPIVMDRGGRNWDYSFLERVVLEVVILTLLVVPLITVLIGNEMKIISQQTYVESAKTLGGDSRHILWKHIFPQLAPRLFILFGQQFIQVLLIFVHLGLFYLFFGGTIISLSETPDPPRSLTYEWSGLIADARDAFMYQKYWLVVPALAAFMLCILAMQLIVQGVKEVQQRKVGVLMPKRSRKKQGADLEKPVSLKEKNSFSLLSKKNRQAM